jgi:ABC-type microcin C transport system permease subunit YejE
LKAVFGIWLFCNTISVGLFVFDDNLKMRVFAFYFLVLRSLLIVLITTVKPLYQTYKGNVYIPIPPTKDSIDSIDMVLHIPIAANFFYEYLERSNDDDAIILFALYADLRYYDKACTDKDSADKRYELADQIYKEYLDAEA